MKIFAYYLPQFHEIPENNEWWGKGYTEWTNVKSARPLYKGHMQPKEPLKDYYYNLQDINTLKWQSNLMNTYKVDGMIFYHYYFCGKLLLEQPCELLLKNKDIKMPFFFCWANHEWINRKKGKEGRILIEQHYGETEQWEKHFQYLLPFFKDSRYEKRNNKPLFMIFRTRFKERNRMLEYFNSRCMDNGFSGLCVIETFRSYTVPILNKFINRRSEHSEYMHLREPECSLEYYNHRSFKRLLECVNKKVNKKEKQEFPVKIYDGNYLLKIMTRQHFREKDIIRGLFFSWDNTPRYGMRGYVIDSINRHHFFQYMESVKNNDFVFVNAWNEWGEGMILEPTKKDGYKFLEWIKEWKELNI